MQQPLLPIRHPQSDFFIADIFDAIPVKADRHTMEHPFFTLSTKPDFRVLEYNREGVRIQCRPASGLGLPTMMDKDILLYVGSILMREINAGRIPPKTVRFSCHDLMVTTNRDTGGHAYNQLKDAFARITGCLISTNIKTADIEESSNFHILEKSRIVKDSRDGSRMVEVEVTVSDWFYRALLSKEVLTLNRDYFRLRKPLERRLYELARKHCGKQAEWQIGLDALRQKCGALSPLRYFRFQLRDIINPKQGQEGQEILAAGPSPHFPDYQITLDDAHDVVSFKNRVHLIMASVKNTTPPEKSVRQRLLPATVRRGAQLVEDAGTGWAYGALIDQFSQAMENGFEPRNLNAAFLGFVKKKVATSP